MFTKEELEDSGLQDFRVFLVQVWVFLGLPDPTPVQLDIAYQLQHGPRRMIVQGFRGVGKSWITVAFVLWQLLLNPQLKIMVVSASQPLADAFSHFCKQLIQGMPLLQHLAPRDDQRSSSIAFDVGPATPSKDPSVKSVGITGQLTGSRADVIVPDDVEIPKNSLSHLMRERLAELVKEFDAVLKPEGRVIYLGTPQVEQSLYPKLEKRGYKAFVWPSEVPQKPEAYHGRLAPLIIRLIERGVKPFTPVDSRRFNEIDLAERKASYGHSGYALQFLLDTNPASADRYPLKLRDLIVHDCDPDMGHVKLVWGQDRDLVLSELESIGLDGDYYHRAAWKSEEMAKYTGTVMAIDPSGRGKDETGYAILKYLHGMLYLVDVGGFRDGFGEATLNALAASMVRWKVNYWIAEENFGGGMFAQLLKPVIARVCTAAKAPIPKYDDEWDGWSSTQKELRILDTLEPVLQSHRLVVNRRIIEDDLAVAKDTETYSFIRQLTRMERVKGALPNEDRLEALSMAAAYWTERMNRDADTSLKSHKDELLKQELEKFMRNALGNRAPNVGRFRWARV